MQSNSTSKPSTASPNRSPKKFGEEKDKWQNLQKILDHGSQIPGETDFSFQVLGVYSPPEFLNRLHSSGSVDTWSYIVKLCGAELPGGKYNFRELTEEEKKRIRNKKEAPTENKQERFGSFESRRRKNRPRTKRKRREGKSFPRYIR